MKKAPIVLLSALTLFLASCGASYTPLTEEQVQVKADSIFNAQKEQLVKTSEEECMNSMESSVAQKVEEMKAQSETASK